MVSRVLPDVSNSPVTPPFPVLCVELECLTVTCSLMAHDITHGGWVVVTNGVLAEVPDACDEAVSVATDPDLGHEAEGVVGLWAGCIRD